MDITTCDTCLIRMFYARAHDMHFDWRDCWCECGYAKEMRAQQVKGSEDELKEVITALEKDLAQPYVPQELPTLFAPWAWWEALGRPKDYFGVKMLVLCPQDWQWRTPEEIEALAW